MEISVIIPVYNKTMYIGRCLKSIFLQDFPSFEVIAVDDGSTDASGKICDQWAETEPRLHVYHIPNGGVTAARRHGLEHSQGRYVMFVDADDRLMKGALQRMYDIIQVISSYDDQYGVRHDSGWRG